MTANRSSRRRSHLRRTHRTNEAASSPGSENVRADARKPPPQGGKAAVPRPAVSGSKTGPAAHEPLISSGTVANVLAEVPLAGLERV